jgi:hypothetical protein
LDLLGGLEPVSTDIRTGLCPRAGIPAGKMFAEARDRGGVLGDNGRFPAAETALSRVPGAKATESQKTIPTAPGKRLCVGLRGGGRISLQPQDWVVSQPPRSLARDFRRSRECRHFRRLAAKHPVSGEEYRAPRAEGRDFRRKSLLDDFSISEIWIGTRQRPVACPQRPGSNPQEIRQCSRWTGCSPRSMRLLRGEGRTCSLAASNPLERRAALRPRAMATAESS